MRSVSTGEVTVLQKSHYTTDQNIFWSLIWSPQGHLTHGHVVLGRNIMRAQLALAASVRLTIPEAKSDSRPCLAFLLSLGRDWDFPLSPQVWWGFLSQHLVCQPGHSGSSTPLFLEAPEDGSQHCGKMLEQRRGYWMQTPALTTQHPIIAVVYKLCLYRYIPQDPL